MTSFAELRHNLRMARTDRAGVEDRAADARHAAERIEARQREATRTAGPQRKELLRELAEQAKQARDEIGGRCKKVKSLSARELDALVEFCKLADPRDGIGQLNDRFPILLFPVRLQTRFKQIGAPGPASNELWVRIYPDDCLVDTFEPTLSESELKSIQRFWIESWQAGKNETGERAAWRGLVAAVGSGRANWLIQQYAPLNPADQPSTAPEGLVLVVPTEQLLGDAAEADALATYWVAVWKADESSAAIAAARTTLDDEVGDTNRAQQLIDTCEPSNLKALPVAGATRATVDCKLAYQQVPPAALVATKLRSWSAPAKVKLLPERFLLLAYQGDQVQLRALGNPVPSPLEVGPDPDADPDEQLRHYKEGELDADGKSRREGELRVPDAMWWMTDFDEAVRIGMGLRIELTPQQAERGFDKIVVLGLRLADDETDGQAGLEELLAHHRDGRAGLSLVPQGAPTNNLEAAGAGYSRADDADASFGTKRREKAVAGARWWDRPDGQWLTDALGIDLAVLDGVAFANGRDVSEARAMNRLLWPATFGYTMETMMAPVFPPDQVHLTRWFFTHFVSGRGQLPALRIGSQPYGILPMAAMNRAAWLKTDRIAPPADLAAPEGLRTYLARLNAILTAMRGEWMDLAEDSAHVGKRGDAHRILLDLLSLHPTSVEFHQRYAESLDQLYNHARFKGLGGRLMAGIKARRLQERATELLRKHGYDGEQLPDLLDRFFFSRANRLLGPLVDDRPLSESAPIRAYTPEPNGKNYLEWMLRAARNEFEDLRLERGFTQDAAPSALLYVLARHALMLGYYDSSLNLHQSSDVLSTERLSEARREPAFIHVKEDADTESRFAYLVNSEPRITGSNTVTVAQHIANVLQTAPETRSLDDQLAALEMLTQLPTSRLERLLSEHVDTASYRLDAWLLGLVGYQLWAHRFHGAAQFMPGRAPNAADMSAPTATRGVYLGAYGYLEEVRPKASKLERVELKGNLSDEFTPKGEAPLWADPTNGGYIFAPSVTHATTAAVLRAGYLANATKSNPQTMAVNLSSERVRVALGLLEGIRNGQSLGALLGYRFERALHERHGSLELDVYIYALRKKFPLVADQMKSTQTQEGVAIEAIEARNVVDGLRMLEHIRQSSTRQYPFGLDLRPTKSADESIAIDSEVERLMDSYDAVADLALAEGVHQAVLGNYDRVASTLDAYAKATFPPEPEVVRTPRSGVGLTHRVGLHFEAGVAPTYVAHGLPMSPRSQAQPAVNKWLAGILPAPGHVGCMVEWPDPLTGTPVRVPVTQADMALQPIDMVFLGSILPDQAMSELDDRIVRFVLGSRTVRPDARIAIRHTDRGPASVSFFELGALLSHLQDLLLRSRPLSPTDLSLQGEAKQSQDDTRAIDKQRVDRVVTDLSNLQTELAAFDLWLAANVGTSAKARAEIDNVILRLAALLARASTFGFAQAGWGWLYQWRSRVFCDLQAMAKARLEDWDARLLEAIDLLDDFDATPGLPVEEQTALLSKVDRLLAAAMSIPAPAAATYRTQLTAKKTALEGKRNQFAALLTTNSPLLSDLLSAVRASPQVTLFDLAPFDLSAVDKDVDLFVADAKARAKALKEEAARRLKDTQDVLAKYQAAADATSQVDALMAAGQALLGEEIKLVPEFRLGSKAAVEFGNALADSTAGVLTSYLINDRKVEFPVDDWLQGNARVREKLRHYEQATLLTEAIGGKEPALTPIQLPYQPDDDWLALEFPPDTKVDSERLLYTAHFPAALAANGPMCGLLIDEWTEVVPSKDVTAGLTFHFDQPSSEPPQAWLLALPGQLDGRWHFQDLVDAVNDAFALARLRSVEPAQVDQTAYAQFLPATVAAVTLYDVTISANLARVNRFKGKLQGATDA
jgi:hypothetical protein